MGKELEAELVFTKALIDACERLLELYRPRLAQLQSEVGDGAQVKNVDIVQGCG